VKMACNRCNKFVSSDNAHRCYGGDSSEIHVLNYDVVCHTCWDKEMLANIEKAEAALGLGESP
jgi:hypothetical protein